MNDPQAVAAILEKTFNKIHLNEMQGIPILNPAIKVRTLGFQEHNDRVIGVLITPWMMNLVMLPHDGEDWGAMTLGQKISHQFPSRIYKFMVNEFDGIGRCQTHSLHSPMSRFRNDEQAVNAAQHVIENLLVEKEPTEEDLVDEELLGHVLRAEKIPIKNLDNYTANSAALADSRNSQRNELPRDKNGFSRRDLLRGRLADNA